MTVGAELVQARQRLGLSPEDLSSRTKISVERLVAIEQMDGEHLPTFLYLKGFLRAYAIEVGLDPDDVTSRYLAEIEPPAAEVELMPEAVPIAAAPPADTTAPHGRYGALLLVPIVALIAGMLAVANSDKVTGLWKSEPVATAPAEADDASKAAEVSKAAVTVPDAVAADSRGATPSPDARDATATSDVSGVWVVTNRIESANYGAFKDLALGFRLQLEQHGNRVTGAGAKVSENGSPLPPGRRTPITVEGTLDGRLLRLTFTERGAARASTGALALEMTDDLTLRGTFTSDAANARGTSVARRTK
jgi:transcriptional regulator with XRE-family HTH domain